MRTAKQDLARGIVAFNDPPRLSSATETALRVGGMLLIVLGWSEPSYSRSRGSVLRRARLADV